jgi:hypothetical protein
MTTVFTLIAVALLVVVLLRVQVSKAKSTEAHSVKTGLKLMMGMQKLVELIQQHRGLSNAMHQGNTGVKSKLTSIEREIEFIKNGDLKSDFAKFAQWESFTDHWPRLKKHALDGDLEPANLMRQHNIMIDGLISLLEDVTRYFELHYVMLDRYTRVSEICLDTIRTAETIAKARGVGSGVCARGRRDGMDSINLNYLKISMNSTTEQLFKELTGIRNTELQQRFTAYSVSIKKSVDKLVAVLEKDILSHKQVDVDSQEYFNLATAPITELVSLYGYVVNYANQQYDRNH